MSFKEAYFSENFQKAPARGGKDSQWTPFSFIGTKAEVSLEFILGHILGMGGALGQKFPEGLGINSQGARRENIRQVEKHLRKFLKM